MNYRDLQDPNKALIFDPNGNPLIIDKNELTKALDAGASLGDENQRAFVETKLSAEYQRASENKEPTAVVEKLLGSMEEPSNNMQNLLDPNKVLFKTQSGKYLTVDREEEEKASQYYYKVHTEERQAIFDQEKKKVAYSGVIPGTAAAIAGGARGLTFGLSDLLVSYGPTQLPGIGPWWEEQVRQPIIELEKQQRTMSTAGEVVGAIAPIILTLGAGAAAEGGGQAVAQTAKAGVMGGVRAAAEKAPTVLVSKATTGLSNAIERGMINEGTSAAKQVMAKAFAKGVGGAVEGGVYGAGQGLSQASLGVDANADFLDGQADMFASSILHGAGMGIVYGGGLAGGLGLATHGLPAVGSAIESSKIGQKFGSAIERFRTSTNEYLAKDANNLYTQFSSWRSGMDPKIVNKMWEGLQIDDDIMKKATGFSTDRIQKIKSNLSLMTDEERNIIIDKYSKTVQSKLTAGNNLYKAIEEKLGTNRIVNAKRRFEATLQKAEEKLGPESRDALQEYLYARSSFAREFGITGRPGKYIVSPEKVSKYLKNVDDYFDTTRSKVLDNFNKAQENFFKVEFNKIDPRLVTEKGVIDNILNDKIKVYDEIVGRHNLFKYSKKYMKEGLTEDIVPFALGYFGAGPLGGALLAGARRVGKDPAFEAALLNKGAFILQDLVATKIPKAVNSLLTFSGKQVGKQSGRPIARSGALTLVNNQEPQTFDYIKNNKQKPQTYTAADNWYKGDKLDALQEEIAACFDNPDILEQRLTESVSTIEPYLPKTAEKIKDKTRVALSFLRERMANTDPMDPLRPQSKRKPSQMELRKFERYAAYTLEPDRIFKDFENGIVTNEAIEVLKNVYPELHKQVVMEIMNYMTDDNFKPNAGQRQKIAKILEQSHNAMRYIQVYADRPGVEQPENNKPKVNNKTVKSISDSAQTPGQYIGNK